MDKKEFTSTNETSDKIENVSVDDATNLAEEQTNVTDENVESDNVSEEANEENELEALQKKYNELNDSHLRLMAEFDNYRKRTLREKAELIKNGGESALTNLLPVVDDFERALQNLRTAEDMKAVEEGIELIYTKFMSYLSQQNVKPIETVGKAFDDETSEAVALILAPDPEMKGKVLDCIQTGYTLNEKVIRHAKVVVGE
jgi:molecular chaperone GrpE